MEVYRVSTVRYFALLLAYMFLLPLAAILVIFKVHYSTTGDSLDDVNVYMAMAVAFFWAVLDLFVLKGARMPVCVRFLEDTLSIETRFLFWCKTEFVSYDKAIVSINQERRVISFLWDSKSARFDPLLWSKQNRQRIVDEIKRHNVKVSVGKTKA